MVPVSPASLFFWTKFSYIYIMRGISKFLYVNGAFLGNVSETNVRRKTEIAVLQEESQQIFYREGL